MTLGSCALYSEDVICLFFVLFPSQMFLIHPFAVGKESCILKKCLGGKHLLYIQMEVISFVPFYIIWRLADPLLPLSINFALYVGSFCFQMLGTI